MISFPQLLHLVLPELIVVATALIALTFDLLSLRRRPLAVRFRVAAAVGSVGCGAAIVRLLAPEQADFLHGVLLSNPLTHLVQIALLVLTVFVLLLAADSRFTEHVGEFVLVVLFATMGMMFLVATRDILVVFLALELLSLSLYVLTGFDSRSRRGSEAALKYFFFGGMSTAFLLFGFSLLYGLTNSIDMSQIGAAVAAMPVTPALVVALAATVAGLGFKIAAVPLHFWTPDVYEAAPAASTAFIAAGSKVASFFVFFELAAAVVRPSAAYTHAEAIAVPVLGGMAALSMVWGNLAAIRQTSLRRLLAYSAIAHAGYMLLALVSHSEQSLAALLYYVVTYALGTVGIFAVVQTIEEQAGSGSGSAASPGAFSQLDGLSRRAPVPSFCLFVFLLSLAGIPPLAGFVGKFYLFVAAVHSPSRSGSLVVLVALAAAMSAVSFFYYLQVLKRVYVAQPADGAGEFAIPALSRVVMVVLAALVVLLGCAPQLLLRYVVQAITSATG